MQDPAKEATLAPTAHEVILKDRDTKLADLQKRIEGDPKARWQPFVQVSEAVSVQLPAQAVIETDALVQDAQNNLELFRNGVKPVEDHGDIAAIPQVFGFLMQGVFGGCTDWEGLKVRIALQRGMTICEDMMEKMDYDDTKPGYAEIKEVFNEADHTLSGIDEIRPLK